MKTDSISLYQSIWLKKSSLYTETTSYFSYEMLENHLVVFILALLESKNLNPLRLRVAYDIIYNNDFDPSKVSDENIQSLSIFLLFMLSENQHGNVSAPLDPKEAKKRFILLLDKIIAQLKVLNPVVANDDSKSFSKILLDQVSSQSFIENINSSIELFLKQFQNGDFLNLFNPEKDFNTDNSDNSDNYNPTNIRIIAEKNNSLYFRKMLTSENTIISGLKERFKHDDQQSLKINDSSSQSSNNQKLKEIIEEVLHTYPLNFGSLDKKLHLHYRQEVAMILSLLKNTTIITGGPGTGKTSVVVQILRCLLRLHKANNTPLNIEDIVIAAPTGRAAARMQESIKKSLDSLKIFTPDNELIKLQTNKSTSDLQLNSINPSIQEDLLLESISGSTVHRLLKYNPGNHTFIYNKNNPIPAKVIIIDEASMLDIHLFSSLLEAITPDCRLIILGDRNQLPSVDVGAVLGDFTDKFYQGENASLSSEMIKQIKEISTDDKLIDIKTKHGLLDKLEYTHKHKLRDRMAILTKSHRSEKSILDISEAINNATQEIADKLEKQLSSSEITLNLNCSDNKASSSKINAEKYPLPIKDVDGTIRCPNSGIRRIQSNAPAKENSYSTDEDLETILDSWLELHYFSDLLNDNIITTNRNQSYFNATKSALEFTKKLDSETKIIIQNNDSQKEHYALLNQVYSILDQARILTTNRSSNQGCDEINQLMKKKYLEKAKSLKNSDLKAKYIKNREVFHGIPIMVTRNNPENNLFNGDCGIVIENSNDFFVCVKRPCNFELIKLERIPEWEYAFATTIHKSQGSEFDYILFMIPPMDTPLMTKEIIYTGLTRAKYFAGIHGDLNLLKKGILRKIQRFSGVKDFINN